MLNIEKYKDNIITSGYSGISCCVNELLHIKCFGDCAECKKNAMEWLLSAYKEPILDDAEKKYLSAVIKPFRKKVMDVVKIQFTEGKQYIRIRLSYCDCADLPYFKNNTMYKGMEVNKKYTLEELHL